jgi:hypothetical protein
MTGASVRTKARIEIPASQADRWWLVCRRRRVAPRGGCQRWLCAAVLRPASLADEA